MSMHSLFQSPFPFAFRDIQSSLPNVNNVGNEDRPKIKKRNLQKKMWQVKKKPNLTGSCTPWLDSFTIMVSYEKENASIPTDNANSLTKSSYPNYPVQSTYIITNHIQCAGRKSRKPAKPHRLPPLKITLSPLSKKRGDLMETDGGDFDWRKFCIELLPNGRLFFSPTNLDDFVLPTQDTLTGARIKFCAIHKWELRVLTWASTDFFGPLSLHEVLSRKSQFEEIKTDLAITCFYVAPSINLDTINSDQFDADVGSGVHYDNEILANVILLLSACCVLFLNQTPQAALSPFLSQYSTLYRFTSINKDPSATISIANCLDVIVKAVNQSIIPQSPEAYYFEDWIVPGKLAAMASPTHDIQKYVQFFKKQNVVAVVRLNDPLYDEEQLKAAGIAHLDLPYFDGRIPSADIVNEFLRFHDQFSPLGAVAVHCRGGIGRTGTLICCHLIREYQLSANEAVALCRLLRPGSVNTAQHSYLSFVARDLANKLEMCVYPPAIDRSNVKAVLEDLNVYVDLQDVNASFQLTSKQFRKIYKRCAAEASAMRLPLQLPYYISTLLDELGEVHEMTVGNFLRVIENLVAGGRLDILESFLELRANKQFFF